MNAAPSTILIVVGAFSMSAGAQFTPVDPGTGELLDPLNYPGTSIVASFPIFETTASLDSHNGNTYIHYLFQDELNGDLVVPRTGAHILGFTQGPGIFRFDKPAVMFGAWFENNSGADDAMVEFLDADGELIGSTIADTDAALQDWTWNGWAFDEPVSSVRVTGFGLIDGFLWFDDLEVTYVPTPSTIAPLGVLALAGVLRRHR